MLGTGQHRQKGLVAAVMLAVPPEAEQGLIDLGIAVAQYQESLLKTVESEQSYALGKQIMSEARFGCRQTFKARCPRADPFSGFQ
jgi:hypothetical protein